MLLFLYLSLKHTLSFFLSLSLSLSLIWMLFSVVSRYLISFFLFYLYPSLTFTATNRTDDKLSLHGLFNCVTPFAVLFLCLTLLFLVFPFRFFSTRKISLSVFHFSFLFFKISFYLFSFLLLPPFSAFLPLHFTLSSFLNLRFFPVILFFFLDIYLHFSLALCQTLHLSLVISRLFFLSFFLSIFSFLRSPLFLSLLFSCCGFIKRLFLTLRDFFSLFLFLHISLHFFLTHWQIFLFFFLRKRLSFFLSLSF
ncbi:unnamed protein product [Acanthosepion pharaonis]|uniref:Uncharacterized protein n=1 Tax=Acanthosepion pharaonis TaxID=158019 RepID=A0A812DIM7_ACAPH|nr:unnamed protein product [Sepia pharaonis]